MYRNIYWLTATYLIREHIYHIGNEFFHVEKTYNALLGVSRRLLFSPANWYAHTYRMQSNPEYYTHTPLLLSLKDCGHNALFSYDTYTDARAHTRQRIIRKAFISSAPFQSNGGLLQRNEKKKEKDEWE